MPLRKRASQKGQVLIVVLLITAVALTVGVGISQRSSSTIQQAAFSEESTQALHYAEACVEDALREIEEGTVELGTTKEIKDVDEDPDDVDCEYNVTSLIHVFPGLITKDEVAEVKLEGFEGSGLNIYWCNSASDSENCEDNYPALEIAVIKNEEGDGWVTERYAYESLSAGRSDGFETVSYTEEEFNEITYGYLVTLDNFDGSEVAVRITPRYADTSVGVEGIGDELPRQGYEVVASGFFGRSTRTLNVTRTDPAMPAIFDYVLFSGSETHPLEKE